MKVDDNYCCLCVRKIEEDDMFSNTRVSYINQEPYWLCKKCLKNNFVITDLINKENKE